jgi:hypothetical protein
MAIFSLIQVLLNVIFVFLSKRILDLLAQEDGRVRTTGELSLIDETTMIARTTEPAATNAIQATVPANAVYECDDPNSIYFSRIECKKQRASSSATPAVAPSSQQALSTITPRKQAIK